MLRLSLVVLVALALVKPLQAQDTFSIEVLRLINTARTLAGVPVLYWNGSLAAAANVHSEDMAAQGTLSHAGSDGSQFWERAGRAGYPMVTGAQNVLARADLSAQNTVSQWQQNDANNANLLSPDFQEAGFDYARSTSGTYYFTLLLGRQSGFIPPTQVSTPTAIPTSAPAGNTPLPMEPTLAAIQPTALPLPTRDPLVLTLSAPMPTATSDIRLSVTPAAMPTMPAMEMAAVQADLRLYISPETVTFQNISSSAIDMTGLMLMSDNARLEMTRFDNGFLSAPLSALPSQDCLQVWAANVNQVLPRPVQCDVRHGWIVVGEPSIFWRGTATFQVLNFGSVVGVCPTSDGQPIVCDISFSNEVADIRATATPSVPSSAVVNAGVVRIRIEEGGVTVQNLTGSSIDLSGYVFAGEGTFNASLWNTPDLTRPLQAIPSGDCLQVWAVGVTNLPKPDTCRYRHGWVVVSSQRQFWDNGSFTVSDNGRVLGQCEAGSAMCDIRP